MVVHGSGFNTALPFPIVALLTLLFIIIYVRIVVYCINDLYNPERRVLVFTKDVWALIIVVGSILGMLAYFLIGRDNS